MCKGDLGLARSGIFLRARLDGANHFEVASENRSFKKIAFRAPAIFEREEEGRTADCSSAPVTRGGALKNIGCAQGPDAN